MSLKKQYSSLPLAIDKLKGIPYQLLSCKGQNNIYECSQSRSSHYFKVNNQYFTIQSIWMLNPLNIYIDISHFNSECVYTIYQDGQFNLDYLNAKCGSTPRKNSWKQ